MPSEKAVLVTDRAKVFETLMSSPGMTETCKITLNPSRQAILLLSRIIEAGIKREEGKEGDELLSVLPPKSVDELQEMITELLQKSGLVEFYSRLKLL